MAGLGGLAVLALLAGTAARAAEWEAMTAELLKAAKPGYGGLSGVAVDHRSGDLYVCVSDRGVYRSADQGRTWKPFGKPFKGRTEWPGALMIDPVGKGKRLAVATVYGAPIALGSTEGGDWKFLAPRSSHVDWCALDWGDADPKFVLALKHESGGLLIASRDGGKTFADVGKGYGPAWVFDDKTAVVARTRTKEKTKPVLMRTTDGGKTFAGGDAFFAEALPKWRGGTLYWLTDRQLIATKDKGESWKVLGEVKGGRYGPLFGKGGKHLFVLTNAGVIESRDGGASWGAPVALPKELRPVGALSWMDYDPTRDVLYAMKMGSQLYKLARRPK
jgi:hypothetical protein